LRKAGNLIRITAQLVEAETGNHIWAERYDREFVDIFAVQDEIATAVTIAVAPAVADVELRRAICKPPSSLDAWGAFQRGLWHMKGRIAIDGLPGNDNGAGEGNTGCSIGAPPSPTRYTRTGRAMFLTWCSPRSSNAKGSRSRTWSWTVLETSTPPGSAKASSRAATFTPVAENVLLLNDHIAEVDADAEPNPALLGHLGLAVGHPPLDLDRAAHGVDHARKFRQEPVAGVLYDPPSVLPDLGVDQLPEVRGEALVSALFVSTHQARVPRHVGGEDCGEAADRGHSLPGGRLA